MTNNELSPALVQACDLHRALRERFGLFDPVTRKARRLAWALAPEGLRTTAFRRALETALAEPPEAGLH